MKISPPLMILRRQVTLNLVRQMTLEKVQILFFEISQSLSKWMKTRGMGAIGNMLSGSVGQRVIHQSTVPALLVK
jgi:hypothetical protein